MDKESRFREVIEAYKDRVYRLCCCYVSGLDERKDVYQDALVNIWRSLDRFEGKSEVSTWIYRIVVNTCLGYLRKERIRNKVFDNMTVIDEADVPNLEQAQDSLEVMSDVQHLYACVDRLPYVDRTLVSLYLEDLSTKEMADILSISEVNVRVKLHRIKKTLREMWREVEHGTE